MLNMLGKNFSRQHFDYFFLFPPENSSWHFMQFFSLGDSLFEMVKPIFEKKNNNNIFWENQKKKLSICHLLNFPRKVQVNESEMQICQGPVVQSIIREVKQFWKW